MDKQKQYANLLIKAGLNLQKGQALVIHCPVDCADFARLCADAAYDAGCKEVFLDWSDDYIRRQRYLRADESTFDKFPAWQKLLYLDTASQGAAQLSILATDPELLKGVEPDRIKRANVVQGTELKEYLDKVSASEFQWCVASAPTASWAAKVFPDKNIDDAVGALQDAIYSTVRIFDDGDPFELWEEHRRDVGRRKDTLTGYNFNSLHYKNSIGTDVTVGLPHNHFWEGGFETAKNSIDFCANMPTEEIFTSPLKTGVNGVIVSSKPLAHNGNIIDNFKLTLENGKIIKAEAERGQDTLENALSLDEGASYLGEVALVAHDSPISSQNILFYNTLFDENASCHFAFGNAYPCVKGGRDMTAEQRIEAGLNDSITHVDFMIGTHDLSIVGTTHNGQEIPVFVDGNFAF